MSKCIKILPAKSMLVSSGPEWIWLVEADDIHLRELTVKNAFIGDLVL